MDKIITTIIGVIAAIGISGFLFIGANKVFDFAPTRWSLFTGMLGGGAGLTVGIMVWGNRISDPGWIALSVAVVVGAAVGFQLGRVEDRLQRVAAGVVGGSLIGLVIGVTAREETLEFQQLRDVRVLPPNLPDIEVGPLVLWAVIGAAVGVSIWALRGKRRPIVGPLVFWTTIGWLVGAFVVPDIGPGSVGDAVLGFTVAGAGLGAAASLTRIPDRAQRGQISLGSRVYIFLVPSMLFIAVALVAPTIRTLYLSFFDKRGSNFVGFDNFIDIFTDNTIVNVDNWTNFFTSRLFFIGLLLVGGGFIVARLAGRRTGHRLSVSPSTMTPISVGIFLLVFALFTTLRGTIINNLWWVFTVTLVASSLGLAIAVLADRGKYENLAKSLIFMPMAISFVGAGIIWRFMFIARDPSKDQTGVLNSLWVGLGDLSHSGAPKTIVIVFILAAVAGLLYLAYRGWKAKANAVVIGSWVVVVLLVWFAYSLLVGVGGFVEAGVGGTADTILFLTESPFNNVWMMVVLVWIQTGFTMVIFSAAIKAVPQELLEAAKVDGATESQSFWRVTIPSITPTIGVVVTTLIVLVLKVFDIVKVMTNGNFDTQVIANEMWQRAFTELNFGLGSALAAVLFLAVLPVMFLNIRRMQKAAA